MLSQVVVCRYIDKSSYLRNLRQQIRRQIHDFLEEEARLKVEFRLFLGAYANADQRFIHATVVKGLQQ